VQILRHQADRAGSRHSRRSDQRSMGARHDGVDEAAIALGGAEKEPPLDAMITAILGCCSTC